MFTPEPKTWYVVVTCEQCKSTIFLFPDLTNGESDLRANYIVTCPDCAHKGGYLARHYYHSSEPQHMSMAAPLPETSKAREVDCSASVSLA